MLCFTPLVVVGYLTAIHVGQGHETNISKPLVEYQTCHKGVGLNVRAAPDIYSAGLQWAALLYEKEKWTVTMTPSIGGAYVDEDYWELPSRVNGSISFQMLVGYAPYRAGIMYWHLSNGGLNTSNGGNIGMDLIAVQVGYAF